jgi:hypothetical protein
MQTSDSIRAWRGTAACFVLLVAAGCRNGGPESRPESQSQTAGGHGQVVTGTVRHVDLEGGFYGIEADDGTKLDPVNLPEEFRQDGVRVQVQVEELKDRVSTHMWGKIVRIVGIKRLPPSGGS